MHRHRILFVDDDLTLFARPYLEELEAEFDVVPCQYPEEAIAALATSEFDCVVLDVMIKPGPGSVAPTWAQHGLMSGLWVLKQAMERLIERHQPVIVLTNRDFSSLDAIRALKFPDGQLVLTAKPQTPPFALVRLVHEQIKAWRA